MGAVAVPLSFLFGPDALEYRIENSEAVVAIVDPQSMGNLAPIRAKLPRLTHALGAAGARAADLVDYETAVAAAAPHFAPVDHARRRSRAHRVHERHHGSAEGRADAAPMSHREPAGLRAFARRLSAGRRSLLVTGRLGVDRRAHGRAAARAVLRPADRRLPRPLRSRARVPADGEVPGSQRVPVPHRAQAHDEGVSEAARALRRAVAQHHERRRGGGHHGVRVDAGSARRDDQRDVRPDRDELHRRQLARAVARETGIDGPALPGAPRRGHRRRRRAGARAASPAKWRSTASRRTARPIRCSSSST